MKASIVLALLILSTSANLINMGSWIAETNNKFSPMPIEDIAQFIGTSQPDYSELPHKQVQPFVGALPLNFDARTKWPNCIHPILDQGKCGSGWAFAAASALSDRACIATGGTTNVVLSPEDLIACQAGSSGCDFGNLQAAWQYMNTTGIFSYDCFPYTSEKAVVPTCATTCTNKTENTTTQRYTAKNAGFITPDEAKVEIYTNGPIETTFDVFFDFLDYQSGVYVQASQQCLGADAVKVIGWGYDTESKKNYWLAAESWGTTWGMEGYFKIEMGQCQFGVTFVGGDYSGSSNDTINTFE
jgi:cathepsin B